MIAKREILAITQQTSLTPHVVEKDYVLGWMLAGIYVHEDLAGGCPVRCWNSAAARVRFYATCSTSVASPRARR